MAQATAAVKKTNLNIVNELKQLYPTQKLEDIAIRTIPFWISGASGQMRMRRFYHEFALYLSEHGTAEEMKEPQYYARRRLDRALITDKVVDEEKRKVWTTILNQEDQAVRIHFSELGRSNNSAKLRTAD